MDYFPIHLDLRDRPCLVVGGGDLALHKAQLLVRAGARLRLVAPRVCDALAALLDEHGGDAFHRAYRTSDLSGVDLVVAATDRPEVNAQVSLDARQLHLPVNVVDDPALCSFIVPSILDRSPLLIGVSTGGASPVLARLLRQRLEEELPEGYGRLAAFAACHREAVKGRFADVARRAEFWEDVLSGEVARLVLAGDEAAAERALLSLLR